MIDAVATDTPRAAAPARRCSSRCKGERFDGHDHVAQAARNGAVARAGVARRSTAALAAAASCADTERALGRIRRRHAARARARKVVAITGSNGKTSVKTLVAGDPARASARAYANPGNRNNEIGLPLAVLDAPEDAQFAIYEMGAGKPGDIAYLTAIARAATSALVNNIAPAHLERMGSLLGVADTKGAIYDALPADGVAVINADDAFAPYFAERAHGRRLIRFGLEAQRRRHRARRSHAGADGSRFMLVTPQGEATSRLPMPGRHNVLQRARRRVARARRGRRRWTRSPPGSTHAQPVAGRLVAHRLAQRRGADRRQLQRQSRFARRRHRHARREPAARPGWCSATCANSARTPRRCTPKSAAARKARASRGCTRSGR